MVYIVYILPRAYVNLHKLFIHAVVVFSDVWRKDDK